MPRKQTRKPVKPATSIAGHAGKPAWPVAGCEQCPSASQLCGRCQYSHTCRLKAWEQELQRQGRLEQTLAYMLACLTSTRV